MLYNLQFLRLLCAFAVMIAHIILFGNKKYGLDAPYLDNSAGFLMMGVDIFFLISGFIMIHTNSVKDQPVILYIKNFFLKRIARIYPVWWLLCLALLPIFILFPDWINSSMDVPTSFLHSLFLIPHEGVPLIVVGWTLEYELFFYLCFGLTLWMGAKKQTLFLLSLFSVGIFAGLQNPDTTNPFLTLMTSPYLAYFVIGMIFGLAYKIPPISKYFLIIGITAIFPAFYYTTIHDYQSIDRVAHFMPMACAILILFLGLDQKQFVLSKKIYLWGGNISYSLYLIHILVISVFGKIYLALNIDDFIGFPIVAIVIIGASLVGSTIIYYLYESPVLKYFKKRIGA